MQLISMFYFTDLFRKYAWVVPLKEKNGKTIVNAFQDILNSSKRKPNKIRVGKGSELYDRQIRSWLEKNDIEMHSTHNEGKSVVAEKFIRTLKNKIYKHMTSISKNVYIYKLNDILNEYNYTHHRTIKMKPNVIKDNTYIDSSKELMIKIPDLKLVIKLEY